MIVHTFGNSSDILTPGDFTGDGKSDVSIFRPSSGEWFVLRSEDSSFYSFPFGANGDVPVPADYDGDGKTDAAVFRSSNSTWYIQRSSGGTTIQGSASPAIGLCRPTTMETGRLTSQFSGPASDNGGLTVQPRAELR
ncbi:MAG: VCBS repeat-containing protein [Acidobacteria bacterium]|nr:VCBS repeat-containing protein [Acidobacteriota bacterium]